MSNFEIRRVVREQWSEAEGIVIAIDVIRAFTVAGNAFAGGARELWLVRTTEEAFALRERDPQALLAGEIKGRLIPGFDLNNSPYLMSQSDVRDRRIIQMTGAGTQGAVAARKATHLLVCALTNARATAEYAARVSQEMGLPITFLPTNEGREDDTLFKEDSYCADYMEAVITRPEEAAEVVKDRIARLHTTDRFKQFGDDGDFPAGDVEKVLAVDCFGFVMVGNRREYEGEDGIVEYVEVRAQEV
jgi:2-phosphosulfolactate phosphatase